MSSTQPLDLYLNGISPQDKGYIEPSEFDYVIALKQQSYLKVSSDQFPSLNKFAAKFRVNGIDHYDNTYLQSKVKVSFTVYSKNGNLKASNEREIEEVTVYDLYDHDEEMNMKHMGFKQTTIRD